MPSAEGRGLARRAWESYHRTTKRAVTPAIEKLLGPAIKDYSASTVSDLIGFWLLWQLEGGFEGLQQMGMSRASIYRKVSTFRRLFGAHPDEFRLPGVDWDLKVYADFSNRKRSAPKKGRATR